MDHEPEESIYVKGANHIRGWMNRDGIVSVFVEYCPLIGAEDGAFNLPTKATHSWRIGCQWNEALHWSQFCFDLEDFGTCAFHDDKFLREQLRDKRRIEFNGAIKLYFKSNSFGLLCFFSTNFSKLAFKLTFDHRLEALKHVELTGVIRIMPVNWKMIV